MSTPACVVLRLSEIENLPLHTNTIALHRSCSPPKLSGRATYLASLQQHLSCRHRVRGTMYSPGLRNPSGTCAPKLTILIYNLEYLFHQVSNYATYKSARFRTISYLISEMTRLSGQLSPITWPALVQDTFSWTRAIYLLRAFVHYNRSTFW